MNVNPLRGRHLAHTASRVRGNRRRSAGDSRNRVVVAARMRLPPAQRSRNDFVELRVAWPPTGFAYDAIRGRDQGSWIARPACREFIGHTPPGYPLNRTDHLENGMAAAVAEIVGDAALVQPLKSTQVSIRQIRYMHIV